MAGITASWTSPWVSPWVTPLALDGLYYPNGSITFNGNVGVLLSLGAFSSPTSSAAQTWQTGLRPDSATVVISRAGTAGSVITIKVFDTDGAMVGSVSPTNYPPGTTTVTVPLLMGAFDLTSIAIGNPDYPTAIDVTILDIRVGASELKPEWTHHIGCMEF